MKVGTETDLGHNYLDDFDLRQKKLREIQFHQIGHQ